jgi:hypothetical protein
MASFAIVAEGITDQRVIDSIITGYFGDDAEEPSVNYVQPLLDTTGEKAEPEPGGWGMVLKFLELGKHREALQFNDFLVLHIDTDVSEDFGVPHRQGGKELSVAELVECVIEKLASILGSESYVAHEGRLIFAIAVHSIECWLLPLFHTDSHARKITGCLNAVNEARRKRNQRPLSNPRRRGDSKDPQSYLDASREYTRRKRLMALHDKNPSLALFVRQLDKAVTGASNPPGGEVPATPGTSPEE